MEDEYDWSLQLQRMAVLLLGSAVGTAQKLKCPVKPCLSPDVISQHEWHEILRSTALTAPSEKSIGTYRISFDMDLPASYLVKLSDPNSLMKKVNT